MSDLISRQEMLRTYQNVCRATACYECPFQDGDCMFEKWINELPSAPLYTPDEIQTMQDLEWAQLEKMYELGKEEALQRTQMSLTGLPSAEPESGLVSILCGKTPEEQYDLIYWLLNDYGKQFTDTKQAVIDWLSGGE